MSSQKAQTLNIRSLDADRSGSGGVYTTADGQAALVNHPYENQRIGNQGPLVLQDHHFIDALAHFDRERIPERVVHAKGGGAHGVFECTHPIPHLSKAHIFSSKTDCPVSVRFSTVGGESGSPDSARDPRGFSIKFRTDQGNMDWVYNNTPVFFIRDATKFAPFIHTQKRVPDSHLTHADDSTNFWSYVSENPESIHQMIYMFGPRGIPKSWRQMGGYSGHTFKFVKEGGEWTYCQIHILPDAGWAEKTDEEAADASPDCDQKDLFESIEKGEFPTWKVYYQSMTLQESKEKNVNVFDLTQTWSRKDFPLQPLGKITLNENAKNYFAEIEQIAFNPAHLIPGIEPSADPVLQSRLFSYADTHRHRLGPNYLQLPVNQSALDKEMFNFQRDGQGAFYNFGNRPNFLTAMAPPDFPERGYESSDLKDFNEDLGIINYLSGVTPQDFEQPRALYERVFNDQMRKEIIPRIAGHMSTGKDEIVKARVLSILHQVSPELASGIAKELKIQKYETDLSNMDFLGSHNWYSGTPGKGKTAKEMAKNLAHLYPQNKNEKFDGPILHTHTNGKNGELKA